MHIHDLYMTVPSGGTHRHQCVGQVAGVKLVIARDIKNRSAKAVQSPAYAAGFGVDVTSDNYDISVRNSRHVRAHFKMQI